MGGIMPLDQRLDQSLHTIPVRQRVQAFLEGAKRGVDYPLFWQAGDLKPKSLFINHRNCSSEPCYSSIFNFGIGTMIEVARNGITGFAAANRPTEHVPVIDETYDNSASQEFAKDGLAIVGVRRTDIHQPRQPKVVPVLDPLETVSRKNFKQSNIFATQES
jgi:hypothetical protein